MQPASVFSGLVIVGKKSEANTIIAILAGGAGTRFDGTKQLADINGTPMIRHVAELCLSSTCDAVVVCLGANADLVKPALDGVDVELTVAGNWKRGMSATIAHVLQYILTTVPDCEAVMLVLADQPRISTAYVDRMWEVWRNSGDVMVATAYAGVAGPPAIFPRSRWADLMQLTGDKGAREILRAAEDTVILHNQLAGRDVDTVDDL